MSGLPDAGAQAALEAAVRHPVTFVFLDMLDDPIRVTNAPYSYTFSGTGDEDLDGLTFNAVDARFCGIGPIKLKADGSDTVTLQLSGLAGVDDELMTKIGAKANWQGREAHVWKAMLNPSDPTEISTLWSWYVGVMMVPKITGDKTSQLLSLDVEGYLALLTEASNRTYLDARTFDPDDDAADLAMATANGAGKPQKS